MQKTNLIITNNNKGEMELEFLNLEVDATPSWSGYNYQGKVAIYEVLKIVNCLIDENRRDFISRYSLELEWLEDFSIICDDQYYSIHQVKALNTDGIAKYQEALLGLAKKLYTHKYIDTAYLHVWKKINVDMDKWKNEVEASIKKAITSTEVKEILEELLKKRGKLEEAINRIEKPKSGSAPGYIKRIKSHLGDNDPTEENVKESIQTELSLINDESGYFIQELNNSLASKISLYLYDEDNFCEIDKIEDLINRQIQKYLMVKRSWMASDRASIEKIYLRLQKLIDEHITERHKSKEKTHIMFSSIIKILDDESINASSREINLMRLKSKIYYLKDIYCYGKYCRTDDCTHCKIELALKIINKLDIEKFEKFIRISSPEVKGLVSDEKVAGLMFERNGTNGCFFKLLSSFEKEFVVTSNAISYNTDSKELIYLTTLAENGNFIENCCKDIVENKEIDGIFMDVDYIISKDIETESIFDTANSILNVEPEFELNNHILHCKKVGIIKIDNFTERMIK